MREEIDFQVHWLILTSSKFLVLRGATWPTPWDLELSGSKTFLILIMILIWTAIASIDKNNNTYSIYILQYQIHKNL